MTAFCIIWPLIPLPYVSGYTRSLGWPFSYVLYYKHYVWRISGRIAVIDVQKSFENIPKSFQLFFMANYSTPVRYNVPLFNAHQVQNAPAPPKSSRPFAKPRRPVLYVATVPRYFIFPDTLSSLICFIAHRNMVS